jgi:hypothetical protein
VGSREDTMNNDQRSMYDLVRNALQVQDAVNLSGVVHSFSQDIRRLRALLDQEPGFSTDKLNQHPVCVMYSSKIASLTGSELGVSFHVAFDWCQQVRDRGALLPLPHKV